MVEDSGQKAILLGDNILNSDRQGALRMDGVRSLEPHLPPLPPAAPGTT